jgi:hypothetical protein
MPQDEQIIANNAENVEQVETSQEENFTAKIVEADTTEENWFEAKEEEKVEEVKEVVEEVKPTEEVVETKEVVTEEKPNEEAAAENVQTNIDENAVLTFLKEKGINAEKLEDLKPKEVKQLTPEVEKFLEFKEKTGNSSFQDFLATQKDWTQEPKETILMENLKAENPTLNDRQIEFLYKKTYEFDADIDDDDFVMEREINIERDYQKGLKLLESRKEEFMVPRGSDESIPEDYRNAKTTLDSYAKQQEEDDKLIQENSIYYSEKLEEILSKDFEGFEIKVGNEVIKLKPDNLEETKGNLKNLNNFNNKFFDPKTGKITNPKEFFKVLYVADNLEKVSNHIWNTAQAKLAESEDKLSKNIVTETSRSLPGGNSNITVKVVQ